MEPDRWEEERRRGLTIDLGFAWTTLPSGREVAFVDVPGHQRFLGNTLAGLGPAPVVCSSSRPTRVGRRSPATIATRSRRWEFGTVSS